MVHPSNAFNDSDSDDDEEAAELYGSSDEELFKNTEVSHVSTECTGVDVCRRTWLTVVRVEVGAR